MTRLEQRDERWRNHIAALAAAALTPGQIAKLAGLFDSTPK